MQNPTNLTASELISLSVLIAEKTVDNEKKMERFPNLADTYKKQNEEFETILTKMDNLHILDIYRKNQAKEA